jgi:hypothetical protein
LQQKHEKQIIPDYAVQIVMGVECPIKQMIFDGGILSLWRKPKSGKTCCF